CPTHNEPPPNASSAAWSTVSGPLSTRLPPASTRYTVPPLISVSTQIVPGPTAIPIGSPAPREILAVTRFVAGSIRTSRPCDLSLASTPTQTAEGPAAIGNRELPATAMLATVEPVLGSTRRRAPSLVIHRAPSPAATS